MSATLVLVSATVLSKLLGFLRELLVANYFGASAAVDAFTVGLSLATLLGGIGFALSTAFIPVYRARLAQHGREAAGEFAGTAVLLTLLAAALCMVLLILGSPALVRWAAPGLSPETSRLAIRVTRWLGIFLVSSNMIYIISAIYNALEHFRIPAFTDLLTHVWVLVALVTLSSEFGVMALAAGMVGGSVFVAVFMSVPIIVRHLIKRPGRAWMADVRVLIAFAAPLWLIEVVSQSAGVVENFFAAGLGAGSVAALGFAKRLMTVTTSLLAVNIARAVFPVLSRLSSEGDIAGFREVISKLLRQYVIVFIPLGLALVAFRQELITLVFVRGAFDATAANTTAAAFAYYAGALLLPASMPLFLRACYAVSDTVGPLIGMVAMLGVMVILNMILAPRMGVAGIALANCLALLPNLALLSLRLRQRMGGLGLVQLAKTAGVTAGCAMIAYISVVLLEGTPLLRADGVARLAVGFPLFAAVYLVAGMLVMPDELQRLWRQIRRPT
ncbi:MAG: murein biosynthesis integral membrane protein MurJ [Gammaproteobacteria bacterium]